MYILKNFRLSLSLLFCAFMAFGLSSCSEEDDTVEEYANWQATNEAYFNHLSDSVAQLISAGNTEWKRIKAWSKEASEGSNGDYIIAHVLECGHGDAASPLLTDTVSVHYRGNLLPSTSYNADGLGYQFDSSYRGTFDAAIAAPYDLAVSGLVSGFATALMHMHKGDHWTIYIPYQLGYEASGNSTIPGYSTLVFDLRLVDYWSARYE